MKWLSPTQLLLVYKDKVSIEYVHWEYNGVREAWMVDGNSVTCSVLH
jgi:hypothetical protein